MYYFPELKEVYVLHLPFSPMTHAYILVVQYDYKLRLLTFIFKRCSFTK